LLEDFEDKFNLADILNSLLAQKDVKQNQLSPILYALLVDKYGYEYVSHNMTMTVEKFDELQTNAKKWKAIDLVIAYHHPELGYTVVNPKNAEHWELVQSVKRHELVTLYAGGFANKVEKKTAQLAIKSVIAFLNGGKAKSPESLLKGKYSFKPFALEDEDDDDAANAPTGKAAPGRPRSGREPLRASSREGGYQYDDDEKKNTGQASGSTPTPAKPAASGPPSKPTGARRMTPMYSVPVTNELFHNGNVEAWKKIIQSYETKYAGSEVSVFYEGEKIHDINTLFKWGKVKHGSTILFAILGTDIKDVPKLQRYLRQGASMQFEDFLRFPVNTVLKLF
jgi:hypothetical protein